MSNQNNIQPDDDFTYMVNDLIFTSAGELINVIIEPVCDVDDDNG